jgi:copper chaperone CopZ
MLVEKTYKVEGMTCNGCVASVKKGFLETEGVEEAEVSLENKQAKVKFSKSVSKLELQNHVGKYKISEWKPAVARTENNQGKQIDALITSHSEPDSLPEVKLTTYKPLFMIVGFILGVSVLAQYPFEDFSWMLLMRHFMAGFFIVFAFFKLLNLSGFAESYQMYDIVASKLKGWGFIYPFVELALGVSYLINFMPYQTNLITVIVLGISSIGVIKSNLDNRKIKCACLGDVFNLPMSTVTIVEDVSMVGMALAMLLV